MEVKLLQYVGLWFIVYAEPQCLKCLVKVICDGCVVCKMVSAFSTGAYQILFLLYFTARCYAERGHAMISRPSVCNIEVP